MPSTFDGPPSTKTASGMVPLLLVRAPFAPAAWAGVDGAVSGVFAYATLNFTLVAAALNAPMSYCPDGVFSVTIATARPVAPFGNTLLISSGHALLVALFGTGHPVNPKPKGLPQKFDDNAHPKYGTC